LIARLLFLTGEVVVGVLQRSIPGYVPFLPLMDAVFLLWRLCNPYLFDVGLGVGLINGDLLSEVNWWIDSGNTRATWLSARRTMNCGKSNDEEMNGA
jgi:hypothetical protein